ncbi:uncharacterized protein LOC135466961 [Liolophura sinensis]|uniref:uncharacterized protein LOC135466961 n=1 Tax=Liolophura sinensis TaxID=3198878 RepID=UPI003158BF79
MDRLSEEISFKKTSNRKYFAIIAVVALIVGFVIGILIGRFAIDRGEGSEGNSRSPAECSTPPFQDGVFLPGVPQALIQDGDPRITDSIIKLMDPENIRENLRNLTSAPHLAGTAADLRQAQQLLDYWKTLGYTETKLTPYNILLSYPNETDPNVVQFINETGDVTFTSVIAEQILTDKENKSDVVLPFNAYSPKADVEGDLIYVNYARVEDFNYLLSINVTVSGKIVISRYGKIFRGDKVNIATRYGATGVILYSDPKDYTWGTDPKVYPEDWWLPDTGVQRGSIYLGSGDPLTQGYPATDTAYRNREEDVLPTIPCHPIGYSDAEVLLSKLGGVQAPPDWRGSLNVSYNIGGLMTSNTTVKLHVSTYTSLKKTYNAVAVIRGEIEPDRYVILGNHRDAWVFGAIDPSSGTAAMMEVSRVFAELVRTGWKPRRSILICSWGAEEYGLIGSTEWVEQYIKSLGERAVAYLNVDISVQGNFSLRTAASPLLYSTIYEASKKVPNPNPTEVAAGRKTVYDTYLHTFPAKDKDGNTLQKPRVRNLGAGSDYAALLQRVGIPCLDARYTYDENTMKLGSYPLYHSAYETFFAVDQIIDRGFHYHTAVANFWAEAARNLAESLILPFNVSDYGVALDNFRKTLYDDYGTLMNQTGQIDLSQLTSAVDSFITSATDFHQRVKSIDKNNPILTRMVNDQMIQVERAFTDPMGLPGRPMYRHVVFAPSSVNTYAGASFPGIADALFEIEKDPDEAKRWDAVRKIYSVVVFTVGSAASTLRDVVQFMDSIVAVHTSYGAAAWRLAVAGQQVHVPPIADMDPLQEEIKFKKLDNKKHFAFVAAIGLVAGFIIGILIGRFAIDRGEGSESNSPSPAECSTPPPQDGVFLPGVPQALIHDGNATITESIIKMMDPNKIRDNLRNLTLTPHLAGTAADLRQAQQLLDYWKTLGYTETKLTPYNILLSYPNETDPNVVQFINETGDVTFTSVIAEQILTDKENKSNIVLPFNAYSPKADVVGDLIYVNYARVEDFNNLLTKNVNVSGKIVIARYGKIFRGDKVHIATRYGAIGVILYSDPKDYAWGTDPKVYPDDWWLPGTGVQRGSIFMGSGDPLTPGYPATDTAYRTSKEAVLPKIPSHPIGYNDAKVLLGKLGGDQAPQDWRGSLNVSYNIGGLMTANTKVKLHVSTYTSLKTTYNAVAIIRGEIEPDRYVILGNHRDAWVFGAIDPSSGTAAMMEVSRVFAELARTGWKPRRSILLCSWGAEEYALIGSTEWVEQYIKSLGERAVAYLNVDIAVQGNFSLRTAASPLLYNAIYDASKQVPNPNPSEVAAGRKTVYDTYLHTFPAKDKNESALGKPKIFNLGSGSDYAAFLHRVGVPCIDASYTYDENTMKLGSYPLYHSAYETFFAVDKIIDRGFFYHTAVAKFWAEIARNLAESLILPFNVSDYGVALGNFRTTLYKDYGSLMSNKGKINLTQLTSAIDGFIKAAADFHQRLKSINRNNPMLTRMVNDQMIQVERAFIDPMGLPGRPLFRHLIFAPSSVNTYAGASFPGIADALFEIEKDPDETKRWDAVRKIYSVVVFTVGSAASTLRDVVQFMDSMP